MLLMRSTCTEVSAFVVVVWYTHRNREALETSSLVRAIAKQATIYFLVIVGVQIYLQVALRFGTVRSFVHSPPCTMAKL